LRNLNKTLIPVQDFNNMAAANVDNKDELLGTAFVIYCYSVKYCNAMFPDGFTGQNAALQSGSFAIKLLG